jgi:hypothetical protein
MGDAVKVEVQRSGKRFTAEAVLDLAADVATVWQTITDYPALPRFMPGIRACRVVERQTTGKGAALRERLVVEQQGEFRFFMFAQSMDVLIEIDHEPMRVAAARATRIEIGLLKDKALDAFEGRYEIVPAAGKRAAGVQLRYSALIAMRVSPPPGIGSAAVRQNLAAQLQAIATEVARRTATVPATGRAARSG